LQEYSYPIVLQVYKEIINNENKYNQTIMHHY
jgi:hypothetical protein